MGVKGDQPRFVVLEGLDGAGTTTQAAMLAAALERRGVRVCLTAEPSDGALGRLARTHVRGELDLDPQTAALLFSADRADHLERVIRPALRAGTWVVCDRYLLSTMAYQGAAGVDMRWVLTLSEGFEVPDLTVVIDVDEDRRAARVAGRPSVDRYEAPEVQASVRAAYSRAADLLVRRGDLVVVVTSAAAASRTLQDVLARVDSLPSPGVG